MGKNTYDHAQQEGGDMGELGQHKRATGGGSWVNLSWWLLQQPMCKSPPLPAIWLMIGDAWLSTYCDL